MTDLFVVDHTAARWTKNEANVERGGELAWKNRVCVRGAPGEDDDDDVRTSLTFRLRASLRSSVAVTVVVVMVVVAAATVVVVVAIVAASASTASGAGGGGSCFLSPKREKEGRRGRERRGRTDEIEVSWQTVVD